MVIQKESGGREAVVRARAQVLLRVHSGPTVTFPGPGPEERERERKIGEYKNCGSRNRRALILLSRGVNVWNCDKRLPG